MRRTDSSRLQPTRLAATVGAALLAATLPAGAVVIDSFTTNQTTVSNPPGGASVVTTAGADILGLRRSLQPQLLAGAGPVSVGVAGGALSFAVTATTPDSRGEALVVWDGDATPTNVNPTGLGGQNLTTGSAGGFRILVNSATSGSELVLTVYSSATAVSSAARRLPAIASSTPVYIPFAEFRPIAAAGADFTNVGAVTLVVRGTEVTAAIDSVDTTTPTLAATKIDTQIVDSDGDGRLDPGERVRYTVTISNTGNQATAVDLSDTVDANTTLVAGSTSSTPVARNDQYAWFGNVTLQANGAPIPGLLANDQDPDGDPVTVQSVTSPTALGGTVTLVDANTGTFTYNPPIGVGNAVDTFTYTIVDNDSHVASATAHVNLKGRVWFVDSASAGTNQGTFANPFTSITAANLNGAGGSGDVDVPGDILFVYAGSGPYDIAFGLEANEQLIGQGAGLVLDGQVIVAAGATPSFTSTTGNALTLAANNTLRGFNVTGTTGYKIAGSNFGTLTADTINLAAGGGALDLDNGVLAATFGTVAATSGMNGVDFDTVTGSFAATSTAVSGISGTAIRIVNGGSTYTFGPTTITAPVGISLLTSPTATTSFTSLAVTTSAGAGLTAANAGTIQIGGSGNTVSATGGAAVDLTNVSLGSGATFSTVSSTGSPGKGVNLDTITGSFVGNGGSIANSPGNCFDVNGGSGTITYTGSVTCTTGRVAEITGRTGGTVTLSGNLSGTGSATGINVASNTGGTINFSGATKTLSTTTGAAVTLATNTGATVNFTGGGLALTSTSGTGFNATGGAAAITVQGGGNTITSTTGTALNVASTTIGGAGLTFQSIASNGAASGIVLNATGANGGLAVTGVASAGSGGTIQNSVNAGIAATSTQGLSLSRMNVQGSGDDGILATTVNGLTLSQMSVTNNGNSTTDEGIEVVDPAGTMTFSSVTATGNAHNNVYINDSNNTGGNSSLQVTGGTFSSNSATNGNHGFLVDIRGTAMLATSTISGATISNNKSIGLQVVTGDSATISDFTVSGCTFQDTGTGNSQEIALDFSKAQTSNLTVKVLNNLNVTGHNSHGMNFFTAAGAGTTGTYNARISGNTIGNAAVAGSGSLIGNGIRVNINGDATARVLIDGNVIRQTPNGRGIEVIGRNGTGGADVTITNNDVNPQDTSGFPLAAILVQSNAVTIPNTVRSDIRGNTVPAGAATDLLPTYIALVESGGSTSELVDSPPASGTCTAQLTSTNTGSASASAGCTLIAGPIGTPP